MKLNIGVIALTSALVSGMAMGADAPAKKAPQAAAQNAPQSTADWEKQWAQMQQNMTRMIPIMSRIQQAKDPAERQKLLTEHWQLMQQNMQSMRAFGGPMMHGMGYGPGMMGGQGPGGQSGVGPGMMGRGPGGPVSGMSPEQREEYFQRRLDAMQIMMDQLMQREQLQQKAPK